ncbi:MAG TPA: type II toxin-antitoxin system VapC family toxin [Acidobacteriota bacterium]|nr:type II toxin-antitoxin system VapC family toxin [Acidobacteriota bacterium]
MILVDANLLVYAFNQSMPQHGKSRQWLEDVLNRHPRIGLPWPSLLAFLRLVTNPRIYQHPASMEDAWSQVQEWLSLEQVWIPQPTRRHADILQDLLSVVGHQSNLVPDAHLAALAIEHGLTLFSADNDFARFPTLTWHNPLREDGRNS